MVSIASRCGLLAAMLSALLIAPPASAGINWIQGNVGGCTLQGRSHAPTHHGCVLLAVVRGLQGT